MLVSSYPPFRPTPWLGNPHVQTVAAYFSRYHAPRIKAERRIVPLPDGDQIAIHDSQPGNWITGDRIAILVHGLCGSSESPYMLRTTSKLLRGGIRVIRVDMRGWGASQFLSRGHAHAGSSADLSCVVAAIRKLSPLSRLTLVGFSLGGNIVLHLAGQWGRGEVQQMDSHFDVPFQNASDEEPELAQPTSLSPLVSPFQTGLPKPLEAFPPPRLSPVIPQPPEVDSVIAVSPPIDLALASANLRHWGNRLYDWFFVDRLRQNLVARRARVPHLIDNRLQHFPRRLVQFDDRFLAPVNGFRGAADYYTRASAGPLLAEVNIPALIISSEDDPVVPVRMFRDWALSPSIELLLLKQGGHLGYLAGNPHDPDRYWLDWRLADWITQL